MNGGAKMPAIDISTPSVSAVVLVDDCDLHYFSGVRWTPEKRSDGLIYATRKPVSGKLYLHRQIIGAMPGEIVDHVNRDGLDNRRANLRIVDEGMNARNRAGSGASRYRGVHKKRDKWHAGIRALGRQWSLGSFETEIDAAAAYDDAIAYFMLTGTGLNLPGRIPVARAPICRVTAPHGFPGVRLLPSGRWGVRLIRDGRRYSIGTFATAEDAARAAQEEAHG